MKFLQSLVTFEHLMKYIYLNIQSVLWLADILMYHIRILFLNEQNS